MTKTACVMKPLSIVTSSGFYQSLHPLQLGMSWGFTVTDLFIAVCVGLPDMRNSRRDSNRKSGRSRAEEEERLSDRERVQTVANSRSPAGHAGLRSFLIYTRNVTVNYMDFFFLTSILFMFPSNLLLFNKCKIQT